MKKTIWTLAFAVLLAGCGGSSSGPSVAAPGTNPGGEKSTVQVVPKVVSKKDATPGNNPAE